MHTRSGFSSITRSGVLFLPIFHTTDRDYSRSIKKFKLHPTGTILVRENNPDRVSFVSFPPTLSPFCTRPSPLLPCITNFNVAPVTLCYTLHFRNWLFFGSLHAYNIKYRSGYLRHLIILTGIIFLCFFTPTGVINTPIMTKNIQNAILSQPKKQ